MRLQNNALFFLALIGMKEHASLLNNKIRLFVNLLNGFILIWITSYYYHPHCHFLFTIYLVCVKPLLSTIQHYPIYFSQ